LRRFGYAIVTLCVAAVLLETSLRAGGWLYLRLEERRNAASLRRPGNVRVLCIGESTTALGGGDSFPSHLDRILNAHREQFSVINSGVPATDTDHIVARVPELLDEYAPDIVVAMMGVNDDGVLPRTLDEGSVKAAARFVASLRVVKFARFVWTESGAALFAVLARFSTPSEDPAHLAAVIAANPRDVPAHLELARLHIKRREMAAARATLERAATLAPRDPDVLIELARIQRNLGDDRAAELTYRRASAADPSRPEADAELALLHYFAHRGEEARALLEQRIADGRADERTQQTLQFVLYGLISQYTHARRFDEAEQMLQDVARLPVHRGTAGDLGRLALLRQAKGDFERFTELLRGSEEDLAAAGIHPRTRRNYQLLARLLCARRIRLVAVQYPLRNVARLEELLEHDPNVVFVDNEATFKDELRRAPYHELFTDEFAGDFGHGTAKGNHLLARNVAFGIRKVLPFLGAPCRESGLRQANSAPP